MGGEVKSSATSRVTESTYTCADCGGTFTKGWSDAAAVAEAEREFGVKGADTQPDMAIVCDDCYKLIMGYHKSLMSWLNSINPKGPQ